MYNPYPLDYPILGELTQYCHDILGGTIVACIKHKWACRRFLDDIENQEAGNFPYLFNEERALHFLNWMKLFRHRKGVLQGQHIEPHVIQKFVFGNVYGWIHKDTGYRRFNKLYWQVGRKNAKSQSLASVGLYELMVLGEGASEIYVGATKTEQSKIVYNEALGMLNQCQELQGKYKEAYGRITHLKSGSIMRALSKEDRKSGDGLNPQCGIIDEYHAHPTSEILDILDSGTIARTQPLMAIITTAGHVLSNPCYRVEYPIISNILDPDNPYKNERYFVMVNELDKDEDGNLIDDIKDEKVWAKANPIVCSYSEGVEQIRGRLDLALEAPEKMRDLLTKNFNVWVDMREASYLSLKRWALCKADKMPNLNGRECIIGVDLSSTLDLTSVGVEIPLEDGKIAVISHSFMPKGKLKEKEYSDRVPYALWAKQGYLTLTSGDVVDYDFVAEYIEHLVKGHSWVVREICFDRWNATQFAQDMEKRGYIMVEVPQSIKYLSEPTKDFRKLVMQKKIIHDGNPVLTWALGNAILRTDAQENIMLDKAKSRQRIDPIASLINAHVRFMTADFVFNPEHYGNGEFLDKLWGGG